MCQKNALKRNIDILLMQEENKTLCSCERF